MVKTHNKRRDFIKLISSMSDTELNDFIKRNGKPPKPCIMARIIDNSISYDEYHKALNNV